MLLESSKLLLDIRQALDDIADFTRGLDLEAYSRDAKCRAAVERKFEVMGEACMRLRDRFPDVFQKVPDARQLIGFRNRLIHGYDSVDDAIVWDIIMRKLPALGRQVNALF
jgi:uncharacterized protein with HEPN domain